MPTETQPKPAETAVPDPFDFDKAFAEVPQDAENPAPNSDKVARVETPAAKTPEPEVTPPAAADKPKEDGVAPTDVTPPAAAATPEPAKETPPPQDPQLPKLDDIKLPAHAKPNTAAAFDALKSAANAREAAIQRKLDEALAELQRTKQDAGKLPAEVERELAELRAFRESTAVDGDPVFEARFTKPIEQAESEVFERLTSAGVPEDVVKDIKDVAAKHGGIEHIDWDEIYSVYPSIRRFVESRLAKIEDTRVQRSAALKEARGNAGKWAETRNAAITEMLAGQRKQDVEEFEAHVKSIPAFNPADEAGKQFVSAAVTKAREAVTGQASRGELAAGYALAWLYRAQAEAALKALDEAKQNAPADLAAAKKRVAELTDEVSKLTRQVKALRGATPAPVGGAAIPKAAGTAIGQSAEQAMDAHFRAAGL